MCFSPRVWWSYLKGEGPLGEGAEAAEAAAAHWSLRRAYKERLMIRLTTQILHFDQFWSNRWKATCEQQFLLRLEQNQGAVSRETPSCKMWRWFIVTYLDDLAPGRRAFFFFWELAGVCSAGKYADCYHIWVTPAWMDHLYKNHSGLHYAAVIPPPPPPPHPISLLLLDLL